MDSSDPYSGIQRFIFRFGAGPMQKRENSFFGGLCILILNLAVFYLLDNLTRLRREQFERFILDKEGKAYELQFKELLEEDKKIRSIRHDIKNHLFVLREMSSKNDFSGIDEYIMALDEMIKDSEPLVKNRQCGNRQYLEWEIIFCEE